jgi:muramoyltetrapeptide carboxypeptidase
MNDYIKPSHLKQGDIIGIVSPSAPLAGLLPRRVKRGVKMLESLGFRVILGKNSLKVTGYTAGTAEQRAEDINSFIRNNDVKGIFSFIGGNHSNQILEYLDFSAMKKPQKSF